MREARASGRDGGGHVDGDHDEEEDGHDDLAEGEDLPLFCRALALGERAWLAVGLGLG